MQAYRRQRFTRTATAPDKVMWVEEGFPLLHLSALVAGVGGSLMGLPTGPWVEMNDGTKWVVVVYPQPPAPVIFH